MWQYTGKGTISDTVQKVKLEFKGSFGQISRTVIVKSKPASKISHIKKLNKEQKMPPGINQCNTADFTKLQIVIFT